MTRKSSPPWGFVGILALLWIAWLVVAPRSGYILGTLGGILAFLYLAQPSIHQQVHDLMAWSVSPKRPAFPIFLIFFSILSILWPSFTLPPQTTKQPTPHNVRPQLSRQEPTHSSSAPNPAIASKGPRTPRVQRPSLPRIALTKAPTPPKVRVSRTVQAIRKTLKQLEYFRKVGQEQQSLRVRIQQGDTIAKEECLSRQRSLRPEVEDYHKRLDGIPDEVGMFVRAAGQQLDTCLGCGMAIDGKTYCEQLGAFQRDAKKAFKKLY